MDKSLEIPGGPVVRILGTGLTSGCKAKTLQAMQCDQNRNKAHKKYDNSLIFRIGAMLHNHHHYLIPEHSCHLPKETLYLLQPPPPYPGNHHSISCLYEFACSQYLTGVESYGIGPSGP